MAIQISVDQQGEAPDLQRLLRVLRKRVANRMQSEIKADFSKQLPVTEPTLSRRFPEPRNNEVWIGLWGVPPRYIRGGITPTGARSGVRVTGVTYSDLFQPNADEIVYRRTGADAYPIKQVNTPIYQRGVLASQRVSLRADEIVAEELRYASSAV